MEERDLSASCIAPRYCMARSEYTAGGWKQGGQGGRARLLALFISVLRVIDRPTRCEKLLYDIEVEHFFSVVFLLDAKILKGVEALGGACRGLFRSWTRI